MIVDKLREQKNLSGFLDTAPHHAKVWCTPHARETHMVRKYRGEWVVIVGQFDATLTAVRFEEDRTNSIVLVKSTDLQ